MGSLVLAVTLQLPPSVVSSLSRICVTFAASIRHTLVLLIQQKQFKKAQPSKSATCTPLQRVKKSKA